MNSDDRSDTSGCCDEAVSAKILAYLTATYLQPDGQALELGLDTELVELNLLDSFSILHLVNYLHAELGAQIPIEKIRLENFATVRKISWLVSQTRTPAAPSAHGGVS